jgi:hypothetical protein
MKHTTKTGDMFERKTMCRTLIAIFILHLTCQAQDITIADFEGGDF